VAEAFLGWDWMVTFGSEKRLANSLHDISGLKCISLVSSSFSKKGGFISQQQFNGIELGEPSLLPSPLKSPWLI